VSVVFIKGDDEALVAQAVKAQVDDLVGDGDRSLMVEEVTEAQYLGDSGEASLASLVTAAQTMPFLTDRRVVVGRNLGLFSKATTILPLVELLALASETTDLVLVWERASNSNRMPAVPKPLTEALKSAGAEIHDAAPSGKGRKAFLQERLARGPVELTPGAVRAVVDRVGDDVGRVAALLDTLASTFGYDASVSEADVGPFLGEASDVPPWELTDAIDAGRIAEALNKLERMTVGGDRHPLQILATLHNHYQRALRLSGSGVRDEKTAAGILEMKGSTFPAKKALTLSNKLGPSNVAQAISLLAEADLDLRGASAVPPDATMSVLVARLARLSATRTR